VTRQHAPAVRVSGLRKAFGDTAAVAGLDLRVQPGEIFGLVGPDGAGKTTVFRLLLGLLRPDAGEVSLAGFDVGKQPQQARARTGYVAQQFTLFGALSVAENMQFVQRVRSLEPATARQRTDELLRLTGLQRFHSRLARDLSGGMKRKLVLACALLHRPPLLLLDEPTTGVDPVSRREFWRMLYELSAEGVTLIVSTPYLDEAERCGRLGFMAGGRLLALDTPTGLLGHMPDALVQIRTPARLEARRRLQARSDVRRVETVGDALRVAYDPGADLEDSRELGRWLAAQGIPVEAVEPQTPTLRDVFSALSDRGDPA